MPLFRREITRAVESLHLQVQTLEVKNAEAFEGARAAMMRGQVRGVFVILDPLLTSQSKRSADQVIE